MTWAGQRRLLASMERTILSLGQARQTARCSDQYLLWVKQRDALKFHEPGWVKLEPPRDNAVLFIHVQRELSAVRQRGIL